MCSSSFLPLPYKLHCPLLQPITNNATTYKAWQKFQAAWRKAKYILGGLKVYSPWLLPVLLVVVIAATAAGLVSIVIVFVVIVVVVVVIVAVVVVGGGGGGGGGGVGVGVGVVVVVVVVVVVAAAAVIILVIVIWPGKSLYDFKQVWP